MVLCGAKLENGFNFSVEIDFRAKLDTWSSSLERRELRFRREFLKNFLIKSEWIPRKNWKNSKFISHPSNSWPTNETPFKDHT